MMRIEIMYILAGDYINLRIPLDIKPGKGLKLLLLLWGERRKISLNTLHYNSAN